MISWVEQGFKQLLHAVNMHLPLPKALHFVSLLVQHFNVDLFLTEIFYLFSGEDIVPPLLFVTLLVKEAILKRDM